MSQVDWMDARLVAAAAAAVDALITAAFSTPNYSDAANIADGEFLRMQLQRLSHRRGVSPSVRPSVRHIRDLYQIGAS